MEFDSSSRAVLLELVRNVIRGHLGGAGREWIDAKGHPILLAPAGCFVTLHEMGSHALRGCVGRLDATSPLGEALVDIAGSVLHDPRFVGDPVTLEELPRLELEISVLSPLKLADGPGDFDLLNDGIYLTFRERSGCFLPQVAQETGWGREQLLDRLCTEKMGLPARTWAHPEARLSKFSVTLIGPEPFENR